MHYNARMIDEIQVHNLALIRDASFEPCPGLTVITGETGAGKTALLSALKLLMGVRASADMVRDGEDGLVVSGRFLQHDIKSGFLSLSEMVNNGDVDGDSVGDGGESHGVESYSVGDSAENRGVGGGGSFKDSNLEGNGAKDDGDEAAEDLAELADSTNRASADGFAPNVRSDDSVAPEELIELVVTRKVGADGRSRASIDGAMASVKELSALVAPTVDLCGQFEHQQLMKPANHLRMLDAWAGDECVQVRSEYARAFANAASAAAELKRVQEAQQSSSAQVEDARFALRRIDEVDPQPGEYDELLHDLEIAEHAEALARAADTAHEALSGEEGALDALNTAASALETAGRVDRSLAELAQSLREAGYVLEDVSAQARDYRDKVDFDPETLAVQQERYSQLQGLLRSFGPRMEDVLATRERAAEMVSLVDDSEARLKAAQRAVEQAEQELLRAADALDEARSKVAPAFASAVTAVMDRLEMGGAELVCSLERLDRAAWTSAGPSSFEFMYRPGRGMQARPLARIASGGEVSRVMLATKVVLGAEDDVDTLVFDEVDAGVGGAVAVALADVIADLARTHQVIVVTHLAQVAVHGQSHYVVRRTQGDAGPETQLAPVTGQDRIDEIARMLSGSITDTSRAHARELLGA